MQSIVFNEESLDRVPSKMKPNDMVDNEPISLFGNKAADKSEVDTADSSKQKAVTFSIPPQLKEQEKTAQDKMNANLNKEA